MKTFFTSNIFLTVILSVVAISIPSPPEILEVKCGLRSAILYWSPTGEAQVDEYKIQYKSSWLPDWQDYGFKPAVTKENVRLILRPWANYTFRVAAVNNAGVSNFSTESEKTCVTEEDVPYENPKEVYGRGNGPKNLVISWKPMPPYLQNAPGFFYTVYWRLNDDPSDHWHQKNILDWETHKLLIENQPKLRPYRIKVEAHNSMGNAKVEAEEVIGFSDEDKPSEAPNNLVVVEIIDGKSAILQWDPVPPLSLNGHFKGYKVQAWRNESYENRTEKLIPANTTKTLVDIFTPGEINNVVVLAFNGAFDGPPSNSINFEMPEDIYPDPPEFIWTRMIDQRNNPIIRITYEPNVTNGNPGKKIYIQYRKKGIDSVDPWQSTVKENIDGGAKQTNDLVDLEFDVFYEIRVVAESGKLISPSNTSTIDTGTKKWPKPTTTTTPSTTTVTQTTTPVLFPSNPKEENPKEHNFPPSRDVEPNANTDNNQNYPEVTQMGDETPESQGFANSPWFIALIVLLIFICGFVGVFVFLKKRRTGVQINNRKSRVKAEVVRNVNITPNNANSSEPERSSFIIPIDNSRNGNVGHDEADDDDDDHPGRTIYQGTTETIK